MDLLTPPPPPTTTTATATATAATVKTPDLETETPQSNTITKHLPPPLTNGVLKRHKPIYQPLAPLTAPAVAYKECLKNHAASIGGHAVDGCGEFMPSPASSPTYPTSLKCAACGCHRNFHRRQPEEPPSYLNHHHPPIQHVIEYQPIHRHHPPPPPQTLPPPPSAGAGAAVDGGSGSPGNSPSPPPISSSYYPSAPHMLLALSTGLSPETHHHPPVSAVGAAVHGSAGAGAGKKRFRTKFTQNQKEKMHEIAEKVGWKMQKRDEEMIVGFCNEIGVEKGVFKVWMHNNKTTFGSSSSNNKKEFGEFNGNGSNGGGGGGGDGIDFIISRNNGNGNGSNDGGRREVVGDFNDRREVTGNLNDLHLHDSYSKGGIVICTKGSSSSS